MDEIFSKLAEAAATAGPFGAVLGLVLYWLERSERLRLQGERDALLERVLNGLNSVAGPVKEISEVLKSGRRRG